MVVDRNQSESRSAELIDDGGCCSADCPTDARNSISKSDETIERFVAARSGSPAAIGELLQSCRNYLMLIAGTALSLELQAKVGASDLVQETFTEAHRIFDRFEGETKDELLRWLTKILEHRIGNTLKRYYAAACRDVQREVNWYQLFGSGVIGDFSDGSGKSPSAICSRKEDEQRYQQAMSSLTEEQQTVIQLRVQEGLTFEAVSLRMNRSAESARKLFTRAVVRLQNLLDTNHDQRHDIH